MSKLPKAKSKDEAKDRVTYRTVAAATQATTKTATPEAAKVKGSQPKETDAGAALVPQIKAGALSVDVGPVVLNSLASAASDERQAIELQEAKERKRGDALKSLTMAIVKLARGDNSVRLETVFSGNKTDKVKLNNQIYIALGVKTAQVRGKEGAQKTVIDWTPECAALVKPDKDDAESVATQKGTVRTNFAHMLTKATQAAVDIIDNKLELKVDPETNALMLTGPAMKDHFGEASVLLNEKQTVQVKDKKGVVQGEKELKAKPSFTEIARRAAEAHGKVNVPRSDSRPVTTDLPKLVTEMSDRMVKAIEKLTDDQLTEEVRNALESVANAIDSKL